MQRFAMAIILSCILSGSALAGEIPMVGPAPAPSGETHPITSPSRGEIPTVGAAGQLSSDALAALLSVLGFLAF
jgi:hypothetical protein